MDEAPFNEYELRGWLHRRLKKGVLVETCRGVKRLGVVIDTKTRWDDGSLMGSEVYVRFIDNPTHVVACDPTILRPSTNAIEMLATLAALKP